LVLTGVPSVRAAAQAADGRAVYADRCASCHEAGAVARVPPREVIAALSADRIVASLESGLMRVQGEALTPDQRRAIATYLSTVRPDAATLPAAGPRCDAAPDLRLLESDWRAWGAT